MGAASIHLKRQILTLKLGVVSGARSLEEWVRMNDLRTIAPLVAAVLLTVSLRVE